MDYGDIILFPVFLLLFYFFFRAIRKSYNDPLLQKYHRQAFWIKIIGCVAFVLYNVYIPVDSIGLYHQEGNNIYHLILKDLENLKLIFQSGKDFDLTLVKDPGNTGYFANEANFMVIRLDALFSFITFGRYSATSLIFAAIAFSGLWKLFLFFYEQYPKMHKKFAIAILYFPTVVFWSSGILKDTLCLAAVGWITYAVYELLYRKKAILKNIFVLFIFGYLLAIVKVYILLAYVPFFVLFIILKNMNGVKNQFLKYLLAPLLIVLSVFAFTRLMETFNQELGAYAIDGVTKSITSLNKGLEQKTGREDAASNFNLGAEFDGSFTGLIKLAPYAIGATFFRPFIWETGKVSQLLAAMESLVLMFFTLYVILKAGLITCIKLILTDPLIMYCFLFSLVFALFVGASTLNFGTLVRYKIPCLPFYTISLYLIFEKVKEKSFRKSLHQICPAPPGLISYPAEIS
jgi:hypothetical protein